MVAIAGRRQGRRRRGAEVVGGSLLAIALGLSAPGALAADDAVRRGESLFEIHCASCHGADARGAGPASADLESPPGDLTLIRSARDGVWPREDLARVIDGRRGIPVHGRREMPVWGLTFQNLDRTEEQEAEVEARIAALLAYLESIQRDGGRD
jgi:mono/diheme cytochrome c family protein